MDSFKEHVPACWPARTYQSYPTKAILKAGVHNFPGKITQLEEYTELFIINGVAF